ncbi:hypothetical protein F5Y11DRAFT_329814 [Daldinia sp. FL1419]|nr:hypothetical protein F5Y11DRAFT_329814 [Daldinia sp. FL1419]
MSCKQLLIKQFYNLPVRSTYYIVKDSIMAKDLKEDLIEIAILLAVKVIIFTLIVLAGMVIGLMIVQRRNIVVQWARRLQDSLHIPACVRIFAENHPGILKG